MVTKKVVKESKLATTNKDPMLGILSHISGLFTGFVGPLIFYLAVDKADTATREQARLGLNWQISLVIYMTISGLLTLILIGVLLMGALGILNTIFCIIAAVKASNGEEWKYPLTIEFIKQ